MLRNIAYILLFVVFLCSCGNKKDDVIITKTDTGKKDTVSATIPEDTSTGKSQKNNNKTQPPKPEYKRITPEEAASNIGKDVIVKGFIAVVVIREKVAFLNFEKKYPKNPLTAVIFASKFSAFGNIEGYEGKTVEVKGKVKEYNGKPEIIMNSPSQIKILE